MAEFILGTGQQSTVRRITRLLEKQILRTQGVPRKIKGRATGIDFTAERDEFEGPYQRYTIHLKASAYPIESVRAGIEAANGNCVLEETEKTYTITSPPQGKAATEETIKSVDQFCEKIILPEVWRGKGDRYRIDHISIELLFKAMIEYKASDVHLSPGTPPIFRVDNATHVSNIMPALSAIQIHSLIKEIADDEFITEFESQKQTSFNYHQSGLGYSRVSAFLKSGAPHCTLRFLPENIPSFEDLHVPSETMVKLADLHRGLLLVTGMTGSGKSTTSAALIDWMNSHRTSHILTIENPIEFVHHNKKSVISQRSLGMDVNSFADAIRGALRHDPDVILIGEMRDSDTIRAAISAAATGHLVVSTLHANTASEVINRIVSFFDPVERDLVKLQLRDCLQCVICQRLVPKIGGGRIPALEFLFNDVKAINDGIGEGDTDHIRIGMQQTVSHSMLFEHYLHRLYKDKKITIEVAQEYSTNQSMFDQIVMGTYSIPRLEGVKSAH